MEFIEFFKSDQRLLFIVVLIIFFVVLFVVVNRISMKKRNNKLNSDLNSREDDDSDDYDDDDDEQEERFFSIPSYELPEDWGETFEVIVDRKTKVQYLSSTEGYGLTPLIDSEGKPILYEDKYQEDEKAEGMFLSRLY